MNALAGLQQWNHGGDITNSLMRGMQMGGQMREQREQREREKATDDAFRGMASGDPNAVNALIATPGMAQQGYQMQQQQAAQQQAQQERQTRIDIAEGRAPASALAGVNWDDYAALTKDQAEVAKQNVETIGQLALMADTPQKWDAVIDQLGPQFAQYKGQFGQRESVIVRSGQVKEFLEQQAPKYMAVPNDADLVNVKDPSALQAFASGSAAPPVASNIPEGAVADLRANPNTAAQFDEIFGQGAAAKVLGGSASNGGATFP